jgi:large subunit ribosomal protein L33
LVAQPFPVLKGAKTLGFAGPIAQIRAGFNVQNLDFGRIEARLRGKCGPLGRRPIPQLFEVLNMAKAVTIKVKLVSSADTGFYYVAKKNSRTMTDKLVKKKYDPVARKHVEFRESKIK